jgi:hypothetical protein
MTGQRRGRHERENLNQVTYILTLNVDKQDREREERERETSTIPITNKDKQESDQDKQESCERSKLSGDDELIIFSH